MDEQRNPTENDQANPPGTLQISQVPLADGQTMEVPPASLAAAKDALAAQHAAERRAAESANGEGPLLTPDDFRSVELPGQPQPAQDTSE